jgi:UDP-N-acetylmuramoylalanine--D-glutamate ligase
MKQVAVLGEGVTAKSVRQKLAAWKLVEVSPDKADLVIASPGIPPENYPVTSAEIISEIEYAFRVLKERGISPFIIAVTGTNGKTTVTEMISHLLDIPALGNIGIPFIDSIDSLKTGEKIVLELSSYQLDRCIHFVPDIAVLLNLSPDHLARHKTMENYALAKSNLVHNMTAEHHVIFNSDDMWMTDISAGSIATKQPFSLASEIGGLWTNSFVKGFHNKLNAIAAMLVARQCGMSDVLISEKINTFKSAEHRMEFVRELKGRLIFNDSKATNPDATLKAASSFNAPVHVILTGEDKLLDYDLFITTLTPLVRSISVYGDLAAVFSRQNNACIKLFKSLKDATLYSLEQSEPGDVILFSPSSSSYDLYNGYEDRGSAFKTYVCSI